MKLHARRKVVFLWVVFIILMASFIYITKTTWSTHKDRLTENGEPLFFENNTPAYEDSMDLWPTFTGLILSLAFLFATVWTSFILVMEWLDCEEEFLFPPKLKTEVSSKKPYDFDAEE